MKLIRILVAVMVLIVLVGIFLAGALIVLIDPNKIKPVIIAEVKKQTGYNLAIDGNLTWTIYPIAGVKIKHMTITAPKETVPFVDLTDVRLATKAKDLLRGLARWQGDVYIDEATFARIHFTKAHVSIDWAQQVLTLKPITAQLYDGSFTGSAHGRNFQTLPKWDFNVQADNIQVAQVLNDVMGENSKVKVAGVGQLSLNGVTTGKNRNQILSSLTGGSVLEIKNGLIQGVDINYLVQTADALINKQSLPTSANINQTSFDSLSGTANISNGEARTNNLQLTAPSFTAKGIGTLNLLSNRLQLQIDVQSQESIKTGWLIPIVISGPVNALDVNINMSVIEKLMAKKELEKVKDRVKTEIEKRLPGATDLIQNFLGK